MSIYDLPPELLLQIFGFLDARDVVEALRVSRTWRAIAADPTLWRKCTVDASFAAIFVRHHPTVQFALELTAPAQKERDRPECRLLNDAIHNPTFRDDLRRAVVTLILRGHWESVWWDKLIAVFGSSTAVKDLKAVARDNTINIPFRMSQFAWLPRLTTLTVDNIDCEPVDIAQQWPHLKILKGSLMDKEVAFIGEIASIEKVTIDTESDCISRLLHVCPNAGSCSLHCRGIPTDSSREKVLERLSRLSVGTVFDDSAVSELALLSLSITPALKQLYVAARLTDDDMAIAAPQLRRHLERTMVVAPRLREVVLRLHFEINHPNQSVHPRLFGAPLISSKWRLNRQLSVVDVYLNAFWMPVGGVLAALCELSYVILGRESVDWATFWGRYNFSHEHDEWDEESQASGRLYDLDNGFVARWDGWYVTAAATITKFKGHVDGNMHVRLVRCTWPQPAWELV